MAKSIPEIRIKPGFLLYRNESQIIFDHLKEQGKTRGDKLQDPESLVKKTEKYKNEWKKYEQKIVPAMQDVFEIEFYKSVIDVHIAPMFGPKSNPLIINTRLDEDEFVDTLTHELFHVLITDNKTYQADWSVAERWMKMYGLDRLGAVHVLIHAGMKHVYLNVHKDIKCLERDIERCQSKPRGYAESWEYVEKHGYKKLIEDFKKLYPELNKPN